MYNLIFSLFDLLTGCRQHSTTSHASTDGWGVWPPREEHMVTAPHRGGAQTADQGHIRGLHQQENRGLRRFHDICWADGRICQKIQVRIGILSNCGRWLNLLLLVDTGYSSKDWKGWKAT